MKVQLPSKALLSKELAKRASKASINLSKSQLIDCIEVLLGVSLSISEKRQSKVALMQMLAAASNPRNAGRKPDGDKAKVTISCTIPEDLRDWGRDEGVNFSKALTEALEVKKAELG